MPEPPRVERVAEEPTSRSAPTRRKAWVLQAAAGLPILCIGAGAAWLAARALEETPKDIAEAKAVAAAESPPRVVTSFEESGPTAEAEAIRQRLREIEASWSELPSDDDDPWQDQIARLRATIARLEQDAARGDL